MIPTRSPCLRVSEITKTSNGPGEKPPLSPKTVPAPIALQTASFLEDSRVCLHASDRCNRPAHQHRPVIIDPDHERTSGHLDLDLLITQSEFPGHRGGGAAAASGSKGVTRSTFPDFDPNRFPVEHFQELDVGAVDEEGMVFNQRSKLFGRF